MRVSLVVVLLSVWPSPGAAQSPPLTEQEVLAKVSADSAAVRRIRAQIGLAEADLAAAERFPNPTVTVSRESVSGIAEHFGLVSQPFPVTGRRGLEADAARARLDAVRLRSSSLERRIRADVRRAFAALVSTQAREAELHAAAIRLRDLAGVLAVREREGDASGFDRLRAEREAADVEVDRARAVDERARAQGTVAAFLGPDVDPLALKAIPNRDARMPLPDADLLLERARAARTDLAALRREIDAARFAQRAAARAVIPVPELTGGVKTSSAGRGDTGSVIALNAVIPLFDRARPERARAVARERELTAELDFRLAELRASLLVQRAIVQQRRDALERFRGGAVDASSNLERIATLSYQEGERGILELLDAYRSGAAARVRLRELELDLSEAEIELEYLAGWDR